MKHRDQGIRASDFWLPEVVGLGPRWTAVSQSRTIYDSHLRRSVYRPFFDSLCIISSEFGTKFALDLSLSSGSEDPRGAVAMM